MSLRKSLTLPLSSGSFSLELKDANRVRALIIDLATGVFVLEGKDLSLVPGSGLLVGTGQFQLTGSDVALLASLFRKRFEETDYRQTIMIKNQSNPNSVIIEAA